MDPLPPIKPKCMVPYYTKTVLPIVKYRHTQGRQTPSPLCKSNPSVQSLTTPKQYDIAKCRHTQCQCTP